MLSSPQDFLRIGDHDRDIAFVDVVMLSFFLLLSMVGAIQVAVLQQMFRSR